MDAINQVNIGTIKIKNKGESGMTAIIAIAVAFFICGAIVACAAIHYVVAVGKFEHTTPTVVLKQTEKPNE